MNKLILISFTFFFFSSMYSQKSKKAVTPNYFYEQDDAGFDIFVTNPLNFDVTWIIGFNLLNMKALKKVDSMIVVPSKTKKQFVNRIEFMDLTKKWRMDPILKLYWGNQIALAKKEDFDYHLPYEQNFIFKVVQGYNGSFSHQNMFALDFKMEEGTLILASRGGKVVEVIEKNSRNCPKKECANFNNLIRIYHDDGTFAQYLHIEKNGALVGVGDIVEIDQPIALSGNTGWSQGPHLHFSVYSYPLQQLPKDVKTKFFTTDSTNAIILEEGKSYKKN